jgi:hypothetical protein
MTAGSTYAAVKAALFENLRARPALSAVSVGYRPPETGVELQGESGSNEAIWLSDAPDGSHSNMVFGGLPLMLEEQYDLMLTVQVVRKDGEQYEADARVDELLYEVLSELTHDPTFGVAASNFERLCVSYSTFTRAGFYLNNGSGHVATAVLELAVEARLSFEE